MTTLELRSILSYGGSIVVSAKDFSSLELRSLAMETKANNAKLYIKRADALSPLVCKGIAMSGGKGNVIFDFS